MQPIDFKVYEIQRVGSTPVKHPRAASNSAKHLQVDSGSPCFQKMPRQQERAGCAEKQRHCKNAAITILARTRGFMNAYRLAARLQTKLCILLQPLEDARHEPAKSERTLKHWNPQTSELTHDKYIDSYNAAIFPAKRVEMSWTYLNVSYTMQSMHACLHQTGKQTYTKYKMIKYDSDAIYSTCLYSSIQHTHSNQSQWNVSVLQHVDKVPQQHWTDWHTAKIHILIRCASCHDWQFVQIGINSRLTKCACIPHVWPGCFLEGQDSSLCTDWVSLNVALTEVSAVSHCFHSHKWAV